MKKGFIFVLLVTLLCSACGQSTSPGAGSQSGSPAPSAASTAQNSSPTVPDAASGGKDITIAINAELTSLDPHDTSDTLASGIQRTITQGLFSFSNDMEVVPVLAESYSANPDATEYTVKLRQDVSFTDGTPFDADAALVNLNRLSDQSLGLKRNSLFKLVVANEKLDDYTVKITLSESFGAFVNTLAHPASGMISPKALEEEGKEIAYRPVGTGPYMLDVWNPGEKLTLVKNKDYWDGEPGFDSMTFIPVTENGTRIAMLKAGDADFIFPVPTEQIESLAGDSNVTVGLSDSIVMRYVSMNTAKAPLDSVKVRQALNYAIDQNAYIKVVYNGFAAPAESCLPNNLTYFEQQPAYGYDVQKAKDLLAEAGYPDGFTVKLWAANSSTDIKHTQFIQQQLAQVGVKVEIENMEKGILYSKLTEMPAGTAGKDSEVEMYTLGWSSSTQDADWAIRPILGTEGFPPANYNSAFYSNGHVDDLIYEALHTADTGKRAAAYAEAQQIIWEEAPWIFLCVDQNPYAYRNHIEGITLLADGSLSVSEGRIR